jgi:hypothetical protein
VKALTIIQPFAELIVSRAKRIENRHWFTLYRGPLAIHAGKATKYGGESVFDIAREYGVNAKSLHFGAIIGVVDMVDCVEVSCQDQLLIPQAAREKYPWMQDHEHTEGPMCFVLENPRRLRDPISYRGQQGLFNVPDNFVKPFIVEKQ